MLTIDSYDDGERFWREVAEPLRARAVLNNVIIGVAHRTRGDIKGGLTRICVFDGDALVLAGLMTPPQRLSLADLGEGERAFPVLARHLVGERRAVPGVFGATRLVVGFAATWGAMTGQVQGITGGHGREQNLYQVVQVAPPANVPGHMRLARDHERDLVVAWEEGFAADAGLPATEGDPAFIRKLVDDGLAERSFVIWEVDGAPVASARRRQIGGDGVRVSGVYTPPDWRGRGYAAALTSALSQQVLNEGLFCCLFADAANALTNRLYRRIGYVRMGTYADIVFAK